MSQSGTGWQDSSQCSSRPFAFSHLSAGFPMKMPLLVFEAGHFKPKLKLGVQFWRLVARLLFFLVKLWAQLFPKPSMLEWKSSIWLTDLLLNFSWDPGDQILSCRFRKLLADVYAPTMFEKRKTWIFCQPFDCWKLSANFFLWAEISQCIFKEITWLPRLGVALFLVARLHLLNHFWKFKYLSPLTSKAWIESEPFINCRIISDVVFFNTSYFQELHCPLGRSFDALSPAAGISFPSCFYITPYIQKNCIVSLSGAYGNGHSFSLRGDTYRDVCSDSSRLSVKHPSSKNHVYSFEKSIKRELIEPK